jgi:site-specific DNA recombinase
MNRQPKRRRKKTPKTVRCAAYTRKNVDAGRPGEFGSIAGQRKAIRAFLASRKSQGWVLAKTYQDLSGSGGNLTRPALERLLADIDAGKVDCVVVHTFDRLTRSLADQTELFARFRRRGVAFLTVCPVAVYVLGKKIEGALVVAVPQLPGGK